MKLLILLLSLFVITVAMNTVTIPNSFTSGGKIYASEMNENNDSISSAITKNLDSLDVKFIRFSDLNKGDSTLKRINVDTLDSNPWIDSIRGNTWIDSLNVTTGIKGRLTGTVKGTLVGNVTGSTISIFDSTYNRTIKASGAIESKKNILSGTSTGFTEVVRDTTGWNGGGQPMTLYYGTAGQVVMGEIIATHKGTQKYYIYKRLIITMGNPCTATDTTTISKYSSDGGKIDWYGNVQNAVQIINNGEASAEWRIIFRYTVY
jgi:hypothetical protein